jgi:hypothetical protein
MAGDDEARGKIRSNSPRPITPPPSQHLREFVIVSCPNTIWAGKNYNFGGVVAGGDRERCARGALPCLPRCAASECVADSVNFAVGEK